MPPADEVRKQPRSILLRILVPFLGSDLIDILFTFWRLGKRILASKAHEGIYEVLDLEARLELLDTKGHKAVLHKREQVRFLQDNIIAYQDKAWGDGEIFANYQCAPGIAVDRYQDGYRYRVLISLRGARNRGEIEEFNIERTIRNGFTQNVESIQLDIDHPTRKLLFSIVFPLKRFPKSILLIEKNTTRTQSLGPQNIRTLPDGRQEVFWMTNKPRLFEGYMLRWEW